MLTGWAQIDGSWYYLDEENGKITGWKEIDELWYYFDEDGRMVSDQIRNIDGVDYQFGADGAWITETADSADADASADQTAVSETETQQNTSLQ